MNTSRIREARATRHNRRKATAIGLDYKAFKNSTRLNFNRVKARSKRNGLEFNLDYNKIVWPKYCPVLGIELTYISDGLRDSAPSIDRIDNSKGYTRENTHVISFRANRLKNDASVEELEKVSSYFRKLLTEREN